MKLDRPTLLFDGYCNLCTHSVIAIIRRDAQGLFRFASLQSSLGQALLKQYHLNQDDIDSVVLIHNESAAIKSDAVMDVLHILGGFYRLLSIFRHLPLSLRNRIYDWVAGNRYAWFGKKDVCMLPTPELEARFLS
ncbi:MAG: thiol-disulfide oxidoreductase DCC family protein [Candidatus Marinimicrobia bacterium]|nr:thiol-disulfide oxidoreductase DCC family protein [Candidatus Neomarinimicrobiota bacterium]MCF7922752.1 thiol-disulfide oxidoreductase DCC family protein [Candidatus Neomarinimicrobiota bacterium]